MLFAHAHLLRILGARWCGFPPDGGRRFTLDPASISVLGYERETKVVEWNWNRSPHGWPIAATLAWAHEPPTADSLTATTGLRRLRSARMSA